jgi:tRNA(Arg) A34 adenosine deaminase TadA
VEILAIQKANKKLNNWRLIDCDMYVTLEPCSMCMGAIVSSRIKNIYIGTLDQKKEEKIWKKFHIERGVIYGPSTGKTF